METTENIDETTPETAASKPEKQKSNAGLHAFYIILILLLLGGVSFLFMKYNSASKSYNTCDTAKTRVVNEKAVINQRLDSIENQLMQARTQNDSINGIIKKKLAEIRQLRYKVNAMKADNDSLAYYKREIESMRATAIHYLSMIDSLGIANKQLVDANSQLSTQIEEQKKVDQEKTKQIEDLATKVEKASVLKAFNVIGIPLNKNSKPTLKAKKVVKIKVSCTIGENAVVEAGQKTVYIRIVRSDGVCLSSAPENTFQYDNQTILFTEKTDINYSNQDTNVEIYYNSTDDMEKGRYKVNIFIDGKDLGNTEFILN